MDIEYIRSNVNVIKSDTNKLAGTLTLGKNNLSGQALRVNSFARGSRSGMEAVTVLRTASNALGEAAASLNALSKMCDEYMAHLKN